MPHEPISPTVNKRYIKSLAAPPERKSSGQGRRSEERAHRCTYRELIQRVSRKEKFNFFPFHGIIVTAQRSFNVRSLSELNRLDRHQILHPAMDPAVMDPALCQHHGHCTLPGP